MAGVCSKSETTKLDHTVCCLGDHPLQDSKLLPCQHAFCKECIKAKVREHRKEMICPKCQLSILLTQKEVDQLPDDFLYPILQKTKDNNSYCDMCKFENKNIPGTFQCLDCGEVTCDQCRGGHTRTLNTRSHRLVAVKDIQSGKFNTEIESAKQHLCETHSKPNKPQYMELYCEECKCLVCQICNLTQHQDHSCKTIDEVHEEKTKAVTEQVTKLVYLKDLDVEFVAGLQEGQVRNKGLKEKLENEVHDRAAHIIDIVEKVKQDTLAEIQGRFEKEDASLMTKLDETKNRMIRTDSIVSYTETFLEHSDKAEFLQHEHEINKNLKENNRQEYDRTLTTNNIVISEPQIGKIESVVREAFGEIRTKTMKHRISGMKDVPREWMEEPKVLFSETSGLLYAYGLTVTENDEIVAVYGSTIQVYNCEGKPKERINCSQLQKAWNAVAKEDKLYVSDFQTNGNILVMDFQGKVKKTITLPQTGQAYNDKGLAVDCVGNVYISSCGTNTIYKCKSNETNAKVFIQQGTHPDIKGPQYICVTPSLEVVVSNFDSKSVQVYDRNGEFLWQYKGHGDMSLSNPRGICCDKKGYIYICDHHNKRIQVVKDRNFEKCIKIKNITCPISITMDGDNNIVCFCRDSQNITKVKVWK